MVEVITELQHACTRNDSGQHFTDFMKYWDYLEYVGLIAIDRPIYKRTGIPYSCQYWSLEVTQLGLDSICDQINLAGIASATTNEN
jgi:hypothetical protein